MNADRMLAAEVKILEKAIDALEHRGWIKGNYINAEGSCCMVGAIDEWSYDDADVDSDSPSAMADPYQTMPVKVFVASAIKSKFPRIYADSKEVVERINSYDEYTNSEMWAEATIMHFNDHPDVHFSDVEELLREVLRDHS